MYIDALYKVWDRIHIHPDDEEIVRKAIENDEIKRPEDIYGLDLNHGTETETLHNSAVFVDAWEKGDPSTLEIIEEDETGDTTILFKNGDTS